MTDTSSSPVQLTPSSSFGYGYEYGTGSSYSPRCSPGPGLPQQQQQRQQQQQPARAHIVRQNSVGGGNIGKPSPYSPKAHPDTSIDTRSTRAGIGGPPKRRESLSGIGNNLRSGNPAALGRSVGKIPGQQPSGLSNLLQQGNAANPAQSASTGVERTQSPQETDNLPRPLQRRGSCRTAAPVNANATSVYAGPTVFPTNRGQSVTEEPLPLESTPMQGRRPRRATSISIRYTRTPQVAMSSSPQPQVNSLQMQRQLRQQQQGGGVGEADSGQQQEINSIPPASPIAAANPLSVRILRRANSLSSRSNTSPKSPPYATLAVGSPSAGPIIDVVGSPAKASVIYAPVHRESAIGGSTEGKAIMQDRPGLGGSAGKAWMADRPSNLGEAAFSDAHPESGFTKLLRALNISSSKNEDPNKASPSPNSPITPTSPKNQ